MKLEETIKLIKKGETQTVEFKESLKLLDEIGETVSAFSNTKGGTLLIGISETKKIIGVSIGKNTVEELANYMKRNTDSQVYPVIKIEGIEGNEIVVIGVEEASEKPVFFKGHAYKRVGKTNQKLSSSELRKFAKESGEKVYWDERVCIGASSKDIDEDNVKAFLRKAEEERNFDVKSNSAKESLERLGLIKDNKITNAAILLFGKNPQKFFSQAEVRCARFKGTEPTEFTDMKVFQTSIIEQVEKSFGFVLDHIPMKIIIKGRPEREEQYEYPTRALREAIINAICHRDYEIRSNVQIRIFDDRIEIWGCGRLPEPLTPDDLKKKHKSVLRNSLVGKCFFLIKFIEEWGTGTNRIIKECLKYNLPEPLFEEISGDLVVTFRMSELTEEVMDKFGLNERQKKTVQYLKERDKISRSEYEKLFDVSERTGNRELADLVRLKLILKKGRGVDVYYVLASSGELWRAISQKEKRDIT